jgi:hypothetical protein
MQWRGRYHALPKGRTMLLRCESLEPRMSQRGQSRRFRDVSDMSALPPITAVMMQCGERQKSATSAVHGLWLIFLDYLVGAQRDRGRQYARSLVRVAPVISL